MIEQEEVFFSEEESLQLILKTIAKAKNEFTENGISALMWGSIITFCSLIQFASFFYNIPWAGECWWLTIVAVAVQIFLSVKERRKRKFTSHTQDMSAAVWISFGITMFLLSYYIAVIDVPYQQLKSECLQLIAYGIPTFIIGMGRKFTPMIIGGIACWILAIAALYTPYPYTMLYFVLAAQLAWFIPGLILQSRYLKAKRQQHV